jgi:hypothetical protein
MAITVILFDDVHMCGGDFFAMVRNRAVGVSQGMLSRVSISHISLGRKKKRNLSGSTHPILLRLLPRLF